MVSAGGYIAAHSALPNKSFGDAYDTLMQASVFGPIGMKATTFDHGVAERADHANPHGQTVKLEYVAAPVSVEKWIPSIRPAGGAWSNAHDMARLILTELGKGKTPEGKQIVSETNLLKRYEPQVKAADNASYGLGIAIKDDHGVRVISHNGGTLGFNADMFFFPEHGVGAILLTNVDGAGPFLHSVRRRLLEVMFDGRPEAQQDLEFSLKRREETSAKELEKLALTPDADWVRTLVGQYESKELGQIAIEYDGTKATLNTGEWKSTFGQQKEEDGRSKIVLLDPPFMGFDFLADVKGGKPILTLEKPQHKYVFEPVGSSSH